MGLFRSSKPSEPGQGDPAASQESDQSTGKGRPTPTRKEAEAARRERMNPTLSPKEAKARDRQAKAAERQRSWEAYDNTPQRILMRNVVDSRFNLGEVFMPLVMLFLVASLIPALFPYLSWVMYLMWAFLLTLILDTYLMWRRFKQLAAERIPNASLKGTLFYGFNRQLSFRNWRKPRPEVNRGEQI